MFFLSPEDVWKDNEHVKGEKLNKILEYEGY
jgi:hypothetical protein